MAYTRADLVAVNKAIASGLLEVRYGDKVVRYPSVDELIKAKKHILDDLRTQEGRKRSRIVRLRSLGKGV